jgi:hypothetical protein
MLIVARLRGKCAERIIYGFGHSCIIDAQDKSVERIISGFGFSLDIEAQDKGVGFSC